MSASTFSGSFVGDGSGLTGVTGGGSGFPFSGSAQITGGLAITGSLFAQPEPEALAKISGGLAVGNLGQGTTGFYHAPDYQYTTLGTGTGNNAIAMGETGTGANSEGINLIANGTEKRITIKSSTSTPPIGSFEIQSVDLIVSSSHVSSSVMSASVFSGSFVGDGSGLTGVTGGSGVSFPYTGSAIFSGSINVTGSFELTGSAGNATNFKVTSPDGYLWMRPGAELSFKKWAQAYYDDAEGANYGVRLRTESAILESNGGYSGQDYSFLSTTQIAVISSSDDSGITSLVSPPSIKLVPESMGGPLIQATGSFRLSGSLGIVSGSYADAQSGDGITVALSSSNAKYSSTSIMVPNAGVFLTEQGSGPGGYEGSGSSITLISSAQYSSPGASTKNAVTQLTSVAAKNNTHAAHFTIGTRNEAGNVTEKLRVESEGKVSIGGQLVVSGGIELPAAVPVSASVFSGSFVGDGSGLTGVSGGGSSLWTDDGGGKISYSDTNSGVQIYETGNANTYGAAVTIERGFLMVGDANTIGHSVTSTFVRRSAVFGGTNILGSEGDAGYNIISGNGNDILSGDYNGTIGQNNIIKGDRNFSAGQTNLIYGDDNVSLGKTNTIGTSGANVNKSITIGEDLFAKADDQILIGFGIDTNASYAGSKGIYVGIENSRPNSGWFTDPSINTTANFALGGRDTMRTDVGIIKSGAGAGIFYLVNYNNANITEPTVNLAGGVAMWAKDRAAGVTGLIVKDESGAKSWIGGRIGINDTAPGASLQIRGEGSTDATSNVVFGNASGTELLKLTDAGKMTMTGSIQVAQTSGSSHMSYDLSGYQKSSWSQSGGDAIVYNDGYIELYFDDAGTDDFEGEIITNPSSGEVHCTINNEGSYTYLDRQVSDGRFVFDSSLGNDEILTIHMRAPLDTSYPWYKITVISANSTSGANVTMIVERYG